MHGDLISLSEQQILDCDTLSDDHGCKGGFPGSAWSYVHKAGGIESEENYPYVGSKETCTFDLDKAVANVTACYNSISGEINPFCVNSSIIRNEESLIQALNDRPQTIVLDASSRVEQINAGAGVRGGPQTTFNKKENFYT